MFLAWFCFWLSFFVSRKCKFERLSAGSVPFSISVCVFYFAVPAEYVVSLTNGFSQNSCLRWSKTPAMQMRLSYRNKLDTTWTAECIPPPPKKKITNLLSFNVIVAIKTTSVSRGVLIVNTIMALQPWQEHLLTGGRGEEARGAREGGKMRSWWKKGGGVLLT